MVQVPVHNMSGDIVGDIDLNDHVFGISPNVSVVHQALVRQLANARQGTSSSKTRSDVSGGGRKPYRQKGTGRARRGSQRSPLIRGGGVIFGPKPRSYRQAIPRKMRRLAIRSLLSDKVASGDIRVMETLSLKDIKTRDMVNVLAPLHIESSVLIVTADADPIIYRSSRNLENVKPLTADTVNVADLMSFKVLVLTVDCARKLERRLAASSSKLVEA